MDLFTAWTLTCVAGLLRGGDDLGQLWEKLPQSR